MSLHFLGKALIVAGIVSGFGIIGSMIGAVWTPQYLAYGVLSPMYIFWKNLIATCFLALVAFGVPGGLIMAYTEDR